MGLGLPIGLGPFWVWPIPKNILNRINIKLKRYIFFCFLFLFFWKKKLKDENKIYFFSISYSFRFCFWKIAIIFKFFRVLWEKKCDFTCYWNRGSPSLYFTIIVGNYFGLGPEILANNHRLLWLLHLSSHIQQSNYLALPFHVYLATMPNRFNFLFWTGSTIVF